jgi:hypothetical protein
MGVVQGGSWKVVVSVRGAWDDSIVVFRDHVSGVKIAPSGCRVVVEVLGGL